MAYRSAATISDCIGSLYSGAPPSTKLSISVVDNCGLDGIENLLAMTYPEVMYRKDLTNPGFGASTNTALTMVEADFYLVLNPDAELRPGVLDVLISRMNSDPTIGIAGCRLERSDGSFDHGAKRSFPKPREAASYFVASALRLRNRSPYLAGHVDEYSSGAVDAISGAFMFTRAAAMDDVGLFDETFWMYGEDLDWCRRFAGAGWRVWYEGTVTSGHRKGVSSGENRSFRVNWHFHLSMARFYRKYESGRRPIVDLGVYSGIGIKFVVSALWSWCIRAAESSLNVARR